MDFAVMGTISSYVKQKNLTFAAKHKIRTGQTLTNANGNFVSMSTSTFDKLREAAKASTSQAKAQKLARIKRKLRDGQKLSDEELGFLRVNDPKTYKKAKHVEESREELKAELKKAKSKAEAREAMTRAMVKASSDAMAELSALGQGGGVTGGGSFSGGAMSAGVQSGGEAMTSGDASASVDSANVNGQTPTGVDAATNNEVNTTTGSDAQKNSDAQNLSTQKSSDAQKNSPEDIMEKYLWTIRALEDEWARFTNSDEYKNLPDHLADEVIDKKTRRTIAAPNRKFFHAAKIYRRAMNFSTGDKNV